MAIAESDWKRFKALHELALERFSRQILDECHEICRDESSTAYERYGKLYDLIQDRDRQMSHAFDDMRRSTAIQCLTLMHRLGVVTEQELMEFGRDVQRSVRRV